LAGLLVAASRIDFSVPSLSELAAACQRYALPNLRPMRLLVARALADGLFFLPAVRRLPEHYVALAEMAADRAASARPGGRRALASALLAFDEHPSPATVGIAPERVAHLLGQRPRWELPALLLLSAVATIGALGAVTVRIAEATEHATVGLPALAARRACWRWRSDPSCSAPWPSSEVAG
jgi:hypothetical protein